MTIKELCDQAHSTARQHGFWESDNVGEKLMLIVSELAEATECARDGDTGGPSISHTGKPVGFGTELADAVIRICDLAFALGIDLEHCIELKTAYNSSRPFKHGRNW